MPLSTEQGRVVGSTHPARKNGKISMKDPKTDFEPDHNLCKVALLIGLACVLQISESLIPHPVPGLRLGLANMLTLTAMVVLGFGYALEVAVLRAILSSFIMGTFMSPTFILSFAGAVISTLVMGLFYWLSGLSRHFRLSIIGISIIGAFIHNLVQLCLAYLLLVKHAGIFVFFPWLSIGAVATGWVVGVVAGGVCRRLQENDPDLPADGSEIHYEALQIRNFTPGDSWLHRVPVEIKLIGFCALAVLLLVYIHWGIHFGYFIFLVVLLPVSGTSLRFMISAARKYLVLILISILLPMLFNSGTHILADLGILTITREGLERGALFGSRILLLVLSSALLIRTTSPDDLVGGLGRLLWPLRLFGVSTRRIAMLLSLAWTAVPQLWKTTRNTIAAANIKKTKNLRGLLPLLSGLIATLYMKTEPVHHLWTPCAEAKRHDQKDACGHSHDATMKV
jgi:heptaprenyl diphosphate synthase